MARNKYPEETVSKILDVSLRLFVQQGYDNTSIQDIINNLGGLSKGAIYHHFKSKESILLAVYDKIDESARKEMDAIRDNVSLTGLQKLEKMFFSSWKSSEHRDFTASMPNLLDNPQFLAMHMSATMNSVVPDYILPVIKEGMNDGTIPTENPKELADVLMLLSNVWMNPLIYQMTDEEINGKVEFFNRLMTALGLPRLGDGMGEHMRVVEEKMDSLKK